MKSVVNCDVTDHSLIFGMSQISWDWKIDPHSNDFCGEEHKHHQLSQIQTIDKEKVEVGCLMIREMLPSTVTTCISHQLPTLPTVPKFN